MGPCSIRAQPFRGYQYYKQLPVCLCACVDVEGMLGALRQLVPADADDFRTIQLLHRPKQHIKLFIFDKLATNKSEAARSITAPSQLLLYCNPPYTEEVSHFARWLFSILVVSYTHTYHWWKQTPSCHHGDVSTVQPLVCQNTQGQAHAIWHSESCRDRTDGPPSTTSQAPPSRPTTHYPANHTNQPHPATLYFPTESNVCGACDAPRDIQQWHCSARRPERPKAWHLRLPHHLQDMQEHLHWQCTSQRLPWTLWAH